MNAKIKPRRIIAAISVFIAIVPAACLQADSEKPVPSSNGIVPYKIPASSFFAGSEDSVLPYSKYLDKELLLTIMRLHVEWQPGLFPYPFAVVAKGKVENLRTGRCDDVEFAEDQNWSHYE